MAQQQHHHDSTTGNGAASANGVSANGENAHGRRWTQHQDDPDARFKKTELAAVIARALEGMGLRQAAHALREEAGPYCGPQPDPAMHDLKHAVVDGRWEDAIEALDALRLDGKALQGAKLALLRERYLEALESDCTLDAIMLLRDRITPLCKQAGPVGSSVLHSLALLLVIPSHTPTDTHHTRDHTHTHTHANTHSHTPAPEHAHAHTHTDGVRGHAHTHAHTHAHRQGAHMCVLEGVLHRAAGWEGPQHGSRAKACRDVESIVASRMAPPPARLAHLLDQALDLQVSRCPLHNPPPSRGCMSLLEEHTCPGRDVVPQVCRAILAGHADEVWAVEFSHHGRLLATASKDASVILWDIAAWLDAHSVRNDARVCATHAHAPHVTIRHAIRGLDHAPHLVAWSPDDRWLLVSGGEGCTIRRYCVDTGALASTYTTHTAPVTGIAWLPCGQRFVSGSRDRSVLVWDMSEATVVGSFLASQGVCGIGVNGDGTRVTALCGETILQVLEVVDMSSSNVMVRGSALRLPIEDTKAQDAGESERYVRTIRTQPHRDHGGHRRWSGSSGGGDVSRERREGHDDGKEEQQDEEDDEEDGDIEMAMEAAREESDDDDDDDDDEDGGGGGGHGGGERGGDGGSSGGESTGSEGRTQARVPSSSPPLPNASSPAVHTSAHTHAHPHTPIRLVEREAALFKRTVTSMSMAPSGRYVAVNMAGGQVICWDLHDRRKAGKLEGRRQSRYLVGSRMGGAGEQFVLGGSEDGKVVVWHRRDNALLARLRGHTGMVSDVAWCPTNHQVIASASDDGTVRLWVAPESIPPTETHTHPHTYPLPHPHPAHAHGDAIASNGRAAANGSA